MTFTEITMAVLGAKGVDRGFIYHYIGLRKDPRGIKNAGGGFHSTHNVETHFRVVLYQDRQFITEEHRVKGGMVEVEHADLWTAVREAFLKLSLELPAELTAAAPKAKPKKK